MHRPNPLTEAQAKLTLKSTYFKEGRRKEKTVRLNKRDVPLFFRPHLGNPIHRWVALPPACRVRQFITFA